MARLMQIMRVPVCDWQNMRSIGYKTKAYRRSDGSFAIRLHYTNVIQWSAESETLFVSTGGWHSKITAQRIAHGLANLGLRLLTHDLPTRPGLWRVADYYGNAWNIEHANPYSNHAQLHLARIKGEWRRIK